MKIYEEQQLSPQNFKSNTNVRSSQIFYTIADESMSSFVMNYIEEQFKPEDSQTNNEKQLEFEEVAEQKQTVTKQNINGDEIEISKDNREQQNEVASRLEIEIKKNNLNFIPVYGQIFIMLVNGEIISEQKTEKGILLVTNYRFAFFKEKIKKMDLPYGFIAECITNDRTHEILCRLKHDICWRIGVQTPKNYANVKIFLQIYLKIQSIPSSFAFSYAHKFPELSRKKSSEKSNQLNKSGFLCSKDLHMLDNTAFTLCQTYPEHILVSIRLSEAAAWSVRKFWNQARFPVAVYTHKQTVDCKKYGIIWRSSTLICQRTDELRDIAKCLDFMRDGRDKLCVYDTGSKLTKKGLEEFQVDSQCQMKYLELECGQFLKTSYISIVQCFSTLKKSFIKDVLSSKWYQYVLQYLKGAEEVSKKLLANESVLIKCLDGRQKSAIISSLAQIIINPFYRTYEGFSVLIQKQFNIMGYPFQDRLGLNNKKNQESPSFIMFLDCVSNLIYSNEMCFEFNYKYLSKLSNLMYTTIFGTFITNSRKEAVENKLQTHTIPIWGELISELTENAYFYQKSGILEIAQNFDDIRIWKEHFWYLTTAPKETYKFHPVAEENQDYINLSCHKIMRSNRQLQSEISNQKLLIQQLKDRLSSSQL